MLGIPIIQILLIFLLIQIAITHQLPVILSKLITDPVVGVFTIIGLVVGITVHEAAHAFVAYRLGDPTAKIESRMTLNPMAHLDPVGTLAMIFIGIGWGKPTPFDPFNLRNIKRDSALISVAGACSNLLLAVTLSIPYLILNYTQGLNLNFAINYLNTAGSIIIVNIWLAIFNLIPVAPLDGFKVLAGLLPREWYNDFISTEKYGIFILLLLFLTGAISLIFLIAQPIISFLLPLPTGINYHI